MPGAEYIGQFGNPWTSMQGLMDMRKMAQGEATQQQASQRADIQTKMGVIKDYAGLGETTEERAYRFRAGIQAYNQLGSTMNQAQAPPIQPFAQPQIAPPSGRSPFSPGAGMGAYAPGMRRF